MQAGIVTGEVTATTVTEGIEKRSDPLVASAKLREKLKLKDSPKDQAVDRFKRKE